MTLAVYPITSKPNTAEALPGTATASSTYITMTSSASTASVNLTPRDSSGTFASSSASEKAAFNVATNNVSGYELSVKADDDTKQLINNTTSTALDSITSSIDSSTFSNPANTSYNGKWGFKPSKYNSTDNTSFRPAPTTTNSTLDKTAIANTKKSTATGDTVNCTNYDCNEYTIALGARADMGVKAGTYTNTFILTAVGNPVTYSITYADNSGDSTVSNLPARQYSDQGITATSINLSSTIPTRTNYTFLKWCLGTSSQSAAEVVTNNGTICNGTSYNAGSSFGIDQTTMNNSTLYAVWSPNITIKTSTGISTTTLNGTETSTTTGTTITGLINGESYNLSTTTATGYSFSSWPTLSTNEGTITNSSTSGSTTTATYTVGSIPVTITPTATINKYTCTKQYRLQNADGTWGAYTTDTTEQVNYGATCSYSKSVTNYTGVSGTNSQAATASGTMTTSGLTLKVSLYRNTYTVSISNSNTTSGSSSLTIRYGGSSTVTVTPNSGYYLSGVSCPSGYTCSGYSTGPSYTGQQTVTVTNNNTASGGTLSFTGTIALVNYCTQNGVSTANCMQTMTASNCSGTKTDARDGKTYSVATINSQCWMTKNLDLAGGTKLESTLSNLDGGCNLTDCTLPASSTSGFSGDFTAYVYNSGRTNCSSPGCYSYYSYRAATAGTGATLESGEAPSDICPKGWRLPTSTKYETLISRYTTGDTLTASPFLAVYAGYYYNSSFLNGGSGGYYWSSTANGSNLARYLFFDSVGAGVNYGINKRSGFSVRCVKS